MLMVSKVCCSFYTTQNKYYEYFGEGASGHFRNIITEMCTEIDNVYKNRQ